MLGWCCSKCLQPAHKVVIHCAGCRLRVAWDWFDDGCCDVLQRQSLKVIDMPVLESRKLRDGIFSCVPAELLQWSPLQL